jgi:hypothetical protein
MPELAEIGAEAAEGHIGSSVHVERLRTEHTARRHIIKTIPLTATRDAQARRATLAAPGKKRTLADEAQKRREFQPSKAAADGPAAGGKS